MSIFATQQVLQQAQELKNRYDNNEFSNIGDLIAEAINTGIDFAIAYTNQQLEEDGLKIKNPLRQ